MPAPCTIVTLVDRDGDEFPVRLDGHRKEPVAAFNAALDECQRLVDEGKWRPNGTPQLVSIELR